MRNGRKPFKYVRLLAKASKYNDIDIVYFCPRDVNIEKKTVNGYFLINNKWIKKEAPLPTYIDTTPYCLKNKKVLKFLKENTMLSTADIGSKDEIYDKIREDGEFSYLLIPSGKYKSFDEFWEFLNEHKNIVVKPKSGLRGRDIYQIKALRRNTIQISYQQSEEIISKFELEKIYNEKWSQDDHILQKHVNSRTKSGDPFDCRVRMEKNGSGKWSVAIYLIRIGVNQKVVSNVAQGGSVTTLTAYLDANFPDDKENIMEHIKKISKKLPYKIEEIFNVNFSALGLDLGIEEDGTLYLFEVENGPGTEFGEGQIASLKVEYFKYVAEKLSLKS